MDQKLVAVGILFVIAIGIFSFYNNQPQDKIYKIQAPLTLREDAKTTSSDKPSAVELTIYQVEPNYYYGYDIGANGYDINQGIALIKEQRTANLPAGLTHLQMMGAAQYIDSTSLNFKDLTDPTSINVLEQNYQYDLVSEEKLLDKYVGKSIEVKTGNETIKGILLSHTDGLVLQTADGIVSGVSGQIKYPTLPEGLITTPTIDWLLQNSKEGSHNIQISYLASGLNWHADYVAIDNNDDNMLDITGWVSIKNLAGATFENAKLKLVAGDINLVTGQARQPVYEDKAMNAPSAGAVQPQFTQQNLFEYHLYTLQRPATLNNNEDKQITLFDSKNTPVQKQYVYEGGYGSGVNGYDTKVKTKLIFENSKQNNLGLPMPKGKVRVYKADSEGQLQFLGEDQIDHTPENEKIRLFLGNAFDIVANKKQTDTKELGVCSSQYSYSVELNNHKTESVNVVVLQSVGGQASIVTESLQSTKESSTQYSWNVPVPASGTTTLTYTVLEQYC